MKFVDFELPSNKNFGFFFSLVFGLFSIYFYCTSSLPWVIPLAIISFVFLVTTIVNAAILLPLNKLWMRFGFLLGMIISPIVLGIIFFGFFVPIAIVGRIIGRDELSLRPKNEASYWISREIEIHSTSFKRQF